MHLSKRFWYAVCTLVATLEVKIAGAQSWRWTRQWGSSTSDEARAVAVSVDGQVYVAGYTYGSLDGQSSAGGFDTFLMQYDSSGEWQWTRQRGSSSNDYARAVAVSVDGQVYVAGYTYGSLDGQSSASGEPFLMQYDSSGEWQWTRQRGSSWGDGAHAVAVSVEGQVYVAGFTVGSLDGQSSAGFGDAFLMQYDSSGEWQWTRQRGTSTDDIAWAVAVSVEGLVYIAGQTMGSLDGQSSAGYYDAFLMQHDSSGEWQWTRQRGLSSGFVFDGAYGVAVSAVGQVYVAGSTTGGAFLMQYDSSGEWQWTRQRGPSATAYGVAVSVDGQVYVAGATYGSLDGQSSAGDWDAFLMQYDSSGEWQWTRQRGTSGDDYAYGVAVSLDGHVYVAGYTEGSLDGQSSAGDRDAFLMQFESSSSASTSSHSSQTTESSQTTSSPTSTRTRSTAATPATSSSSSKSTETSSSPSASTASSRSTKSTSASSQGSTRTTSSSPTVSTRTSGTAASPTTSSLTSTRRTRSTAATPATSSSSSMSTETSSSPSASTASTRSTSSTSASSQGSTASTRRTSNTAVTPATSSSSSMTTETSSSPSASTVSNRSTKSTIGGSHSSDSTSSTMPTILCPSHQYLHPDGSCWDCPEGQTADSSQTGCEDETTFGLTDSEWTVVLGISGTVVALCSLPIVVFIVVFVKRKCCGPCAEAPDAD